MEQLELPLQGDHPSKADQAEDLEEVPAERIRTPEAMEDQLPPAPPHLREEQLELQVEMELVRPL